MQHRKQLHIVQLASCNLAAHLCVNGFSTPQDMISGCHQSKYLQYFTVIDSVKQSQLAEATCSHIHIITWQSFGQHHVQCNWTLDSDSATKASWFELFRLLRSALGIFPGFPKCNTESSFILFS